jgi:hypothetical protein
MVLVLVRMRRLEIVGLFVDRMVRLAVDVDIDFGRGYTSALGAMGGEPRMHAEVERRSDVL